MMTSRRTLLRATGLALLCGAVMSPLRAQTSPPAEVRADLGEAKLQGSGRMRFLGLAIYDIRLWTATPVAPADVARQPLALEIEYARSLVGALIAERSLVEMKRGAKLDEATADRWLAAMKRLFPDVKAGDRITGVQQPGAATRFFFNGRALGEVRDAAFTALFFGIWLGRDSSEPALRAQLLGTPG
jgi:hypothetical protein